MSIKETYKIFIVSSRIELCNTQFQPRDASLYINMFSICEYRRFAMEKGFVTPDLFVAKLRRGWIMNKQETSEEKLLFRYRRKQKKSLNA